MSRKLANRILGITRGITMTDSVSAAPVIEGAADHDDAAAVVTALWGGRAGGKIGNRPTAVGRAAAAPVRVVHLPGPHGSTRSSSPTGRKDARGTPAARARRMPDDAATGPHESGMETPPQQEQQLPMPAMPEIGHPEQYYARQAALADRLGDVHSRESAKVGQYVTLGLDPHRKWPEKLKYFQHALRRHCNAPALPSDPVWLFYQNLADLVKRHCGEEALRLACVEDDRYANWTQRGGTREEIRQHAIEFFHDLMGWGDVCPEHFKPEDWDQLRLIRAQWV